MDGRSRDVCHPERIRYQDCRSQRVARLPCAKDRDGRFLAESLTRRVATLSGVPVTCGQFGAILAVTFQREAAASDWSKVPDSETNRSTMKEPRRTIARTG
jgi:hypothetical protein